MHGYGRLFGRTTKKISPTSWWDPDGLGVRFCSGRSPTLQIDQLRENELWANCKGNWLLLLEALKVSASPRQNSSPVRVLMFLLLAVARRNLTKLSRQSATTLRAFKATSRTWPTSIGSMRASTRRAELMSSSPM